MADNNSKSVKCPICGNDNSTSSSYCCQCGWEFKILLTNDSQYAKQEKAREETMKQYIKQLKIAGRVDDNKPLSAPAPLPAPDPMVGIMCLTSTLSQVTKYLPIYKGVNTFGTDESDGKHQKINMRLRGRSIEPKHFAVEYRDSKLILFPIGNSKIMRNGELVTQKGTAVQPQNVITIGEELEIHLSLL